MFLNLDKVMLGALQLQNSPVNMLAGEFQEFKSAHLKGAKAEQPSTRLKTKEL